MKTVLLLVLLVLSNLGTTIDVSAQGCPNGRPCGAVCCP